MQLFSESSGEGDPVLLVHGATGDSTEYWGDVRELLARRYRVITYDQRGFGRSPQGSAEAGLDTFVSDAVDLLEALQAVPATVVGLSLGGIVAQELAARHPTHVERLVLSATPARIGPRLQLLGRVLGSVAATGDMELLFDLNTVFCHGEEHLREHRALLRRRRDEFVAAGGAGWAHRLGPAPAWDGVEPGSIRCPTLLVYGDEDAEMPLRYARELQKRIPGARLTVLPGAGHKCAEEQPEAFAEAITTFLERTGDARYRANTEEGPMDEPTTDRPAQASMPEDVGVLLDRQAIVDVIVRYAVALDTRDWRLLADCFTPDATAVYDRFDGPLRGFEAIQAGIQEALRPLDSSQHLLGNHVIDISGDRARASTYLLAQHYTKGTAGGDTWTLGGTYHDELVRTPEGWRISLRRLETAWTDGNRRVFDPGAGSA
jgi:pimeloyl-ACP methyl ester carboxylesterase/ketosteroid isomerase-like protein